MDDGLREVRIGGYGSLADVRLEPGRLTVLMGPNRAGKSEALRALRMVTLTRTGPLQRIAAEAGGASALVLCGPRRTPPTWVRLELVQGGHDDACEARLRSG